MVWCDSWKYTYLPPSKKVILTYLAYLAKKSKSYGSVNTAYSAISAKLVFYGFKSFTGDQELKSFLEGVRRTFSEPVEQKAPMTKKILAKIIKKLLGSDIKRKHGFKKPLNIWRMVMFQLLSYKLMARYDELSNLTTNFISYVGEDVKIVFRKRKNDQRKVGHHVPLKTEDSSICPVVLLKKYLLLLASVVGKDTYSGFIFPAIRRKGNSFVPTKSKIGYSTARKDQKSALIAVKVDPKPFGLHSGRLGDAQDAAEAGLTANEIGFMGGWANNSSMPQRYAPNIKTIQQSKVANSLRLL